MTYLSGRAIEIVINVIFIYIHLQRVDRFCLNGRLIGFGIRPFWSRGGGCGRGRGCRCRCGSRCRPGFCCGGCGRYQTISTSVCLIQRISRFTTQTTHDLIILTMTAAASDSLVSNCRLETMISVMSVLGNVARSKLAKTLAKSTEACSVFCRLASLVLSATFIVLFLIASASAFLFRSFVAACSIRPACCANESLMSC